MSLGYLNLELLSSLVVGVVAVVVVVALLQVVVSAVVSLLMAFQHLSSVSVKSEFAGRFVKSARVPSR